MKRTVFRSVGGYVPDKVVTNDDLSKLMETSNDWIVERTGIRQRHWAENGVGSSDLAVPASLEAVEKAGIDIGEIDCIVLATLSPDHTFPGTACFLQHKLGLGGIAALDVRNQCSGFLYGLSVADAWVRCGQYKCVLLVGAEVHSTGIDKTTRGRDIACLFGDGAGAVILTASDDEKTGVLSTHLHADGKYARSLWIEAPGSCFHPLRIDKQMLEEGRHFPKMKGRHVFTHAIKRMPEVIEEALSVNGLRPSDVDLFIPHQANQRITEAVAKVMGFENERVYTNIEKFGNTTAASIPLCIKDAEIDGRLKKGDLLLLASFGAGFTWASAIVRW
jgi:3-oxoacyl-[acyl-carrier-protein] synthase III